MEARRKGRRGELRNSSCCLSEIAYRVQFAFRVWTSAFNVVVWLGGKVPFTDILAVLADNHVKNDQGTLEHCVQCMIFLNL